MLLWHYGRVVRAVALASPRLSFLRCRVACRSIAVAILRLHARPQPNTPTHTHTCTHTCRHTHMQAGRQAGRQRHAGSSIDVAILMAMFHAPLSAKFNARRKYAVRPASPRTAAVPARPLRTPTSRSLGRFEATPAALSWTLLARLHCPHCCNAAQTISATFHLAI